MVRCEYVGCDEKAIGLIENPRTASFTATCNTHIEIIRKMIRRRYKGKMPLQLPLETFDYDV